MYKIYSNNCKVSNCYNLGNLSGKFYLGGGIAGGKVEATNCYNSGKINSKLTDYRVAGILVNANASIIPSNCHYLYYSDGQANRGMYTSTGKSSDSGCTKYVMQKASDEDTTPIWNFNILDVMNSSSNESERMFTITTGRDKNRPVLKWEVQ